MLLVSARLDRALSRIIRLGQVSRVAQRIHGHGKHLMAIFPVGTLGVGNSPFGFIVQTEPAESRHVVKSQHVASFGVVFRGQFGAVVVDQIRVQSLRADAIAAEEFPRLGRGADQGGADIDKYHRSA